MKKIPFPNLSILLFSEKSFYVTSFLLLSYGIFGSLFLESFYVAYDIWDHIAQVTAFKDNPLSPIDPHLRGGNVSHILTPYHLILGVIAKITGLTPLTIFSLAGIFNLTFFLYSVRVTARYMFGDIKYSLTLLIVLLGFWIYPPGSSGVYDFSLIPLTLGYPYRAVFPIILIVLAKIHDEFNLNTYILFTFLTTFVFLTHPLSGLLLMLLIGAIAIMEVEGRTQKLLYLLLPFTALVLTFFWPFYPVLSFIMSAHQLSVFNLPDAYHFYYKTIYTVTLLFIPSVQMSVERIKAKQFDYRLLLIAILVPLVILNYLFFHNEPIARMVVLLVFILHLLTVEWLIKKWLPRRNSYRLAFITLSVILLLMQMEFSLRTISIFPDILKNKTVGYHSNFRYYNEFIKLDEWIRDGGVILAPIDVSVMIGRVTRQNIVAYYYANPAIKDTKEKSAEVVKYFSTSSIQEKKSILKKYHVKYLVSKENYSLLRKQGLELKLLGSIDSFPVYKILDISEQ